MTLSMDDMANTPGFTVNRSGPLSIQIDTRGVRNAAQIVLNNVFHGEYCTILRVNRNRYVVYAPDECVREMVYESKAVHTITENIAVNLNVDNYILVITENRELVLMRGSIALDDTTDAVVMTTAADDVSAGAAVTTKDDVITAPVEDAVIVGGVWTD